MVTYYDPLTYVRCLRTSDRSLIAKNQSKVLQSYSVLLIHGKKILCSTKGGTKTTESGMGGLNGRSFMGVTCGTAQKIYVTQFYNVT